MQGMMAMRHESDIADNRTFDERIAAELADLRRDVDHIARTQAEIIELLRQPITATSTPVVEVPVNRWGL